MKLVLDAKDVLRLTILAAIGLLVLYFVKDCGRTKIDNQKADTTINKTVDTLTLNFKNWWHNPKPKKVTEPVYIDTNAPVDTAAILAQIDTPRIVKDYFRRRGYSLRFGDTLIKGTFKAQVYKNRIDTFKIELDYQIPKTTIEKTITKRPTFYAGLNLSLRSIHPFATYNLGKLRIGGGYSIRRNQPNNAFISLGRTW